MSARELITEHLDLWTGAVTKKSSGGRGSNGKIELTGVKKLRELILQLAVEGKLVQQDSTHKHASELLQAASNEKAQALKDKKIRKSQLGDPASVISESDVPEGWTLTTLSAIGYWAIGNGFPKAHQGETGLEVLLCKVSDMNLPENSREIHTTVNSVSEQTARSLKLNIHSNGTVIFPKIGGAISTNKRRVIIKRTAIDNNCLGITPTCAISSGYLYLFLTSVDMTQYQVGTSVPALSQGTLGKIPVKLPPLEEQHRIVQKVDELMALCDRLEQRTSDQLEAHETLVDTLLGTLTQSENATELADNWARLAAHFDTLFTTEQSIDKLEQTILQLAVMGQLVEQDAGDEPAENMLGQLAEVKKELITQGRLKKERKTQPVDSEDAPYDIPESWSWCSLTDIGELARGKSKHRPRNDPSLYQDGTVPLIQTGDVARASPWITTFSAKYNQRGVEQSRLWRPCTLCITIAANIGDTGLLSFDACFPDSVVGFTPFWSDIPPEYFEYFLRTAKQHLEDFAPSTAQKNINLEVLQKLLVPLPPASEMKRIVQKVDELMALCDQLKERLNQASETRFQLAEAVVDNALN